mmetsp:Transcript_56195/g.158377  ORF Transcript_56195/g.158377 Transcript_56195/m.158377 type:complete len:135 (-) Transcript_56195:116-520(-)
MMHEFIVGPLPFGRDTEDQLELFRDILEAPLNFPSYVNDDTAINIIGGLLERSPELRLGASTRGAKEIKGHVYYKNFDWDALAGRYMGTPWTPNQKKLQMQWEMKKPGEALFEDDGGKAASVGVEAGMEWTAEF